MLRTTRLWLAAPLIAAALTLSACSTSSPGSSSSSGAAAGASAGSASSAAAAPAGSVSTAGVCGLVPITKVNSVLKRSYTDSKEISISQSISDASYCLYGTETVAGQFALQVATSDPAGAAQTFNDATGDKLVTQGGIGDSAMFSAEYPELLVVWGQTTVVVGQSGSEKGDATITLAQLETLATAVHAAA